MKKQKVFLCSEHGEQFILKADDFKQAQNNASLYGGEALRELTKEEYLRYEKSGGKKI